jgi:hypothetical protein
MAAEVAAAGVAGEEAAADALDDAGDEHPASNSDTVAAPPAKGSRTRALFLSMDKGPFPMGCAVSCI